MLFESDPDDAETLVGPNYACRLLRMTWPELYRVPESELPFSVHGRAMRRFKIGDLETYINRNTEEYVKRLRLAQAE